MLSKRDICLYFWTRYQTAQDQKDFVELLYWLDSVLCEYALNFVADDCSDEETSAFVLLDDVCPSLPFVAQVYLASPQALEEYLKYDITFLPDYKKLEQMTFQEVIKIAKSIPYPDIRPHEPPYIVRKREYMLNPNKA